MTTKTTRRAVLAGSAAVAAAAPLATIAVAKAAPVCPEGFEVIERAGEIWFKQIDGPDAPLFDALKEWRRLRTIMRDLDEKHTVASDRADDILAQMVDAGTIQYPKGRKQPSKMPEELREVFSNMPVWALLDPERLPEDHPYRIWKTADNDSPEDAEREKFQAAREKVERETGYAELDAQCNRAMDEECEALKAMILTPVTTLAGLQAKVRAMQESEWDPQDEEWEQIVADILAVQS